MKIFLVFSAAVLVASEVVRISATYLCAENVWELVPCNADFQPENCDFENIPLLTVEDFDRCGPAVLNRSARNFFLGAAGRRITYNENKAAYRRYRILPKVLRDVSESSLEITTLQQKLSLPIGFAPIEVLNLANPLGEIATVRAISNISTVMILSCYASTTLEDVASNAKDGSSHLWLQVFFFTDRSYTQDLVSRAEKAGYEAIVITVDNPTSAILTCNARSGIREDSLLANIPRDAKIDSSATFKDLAWLKSITSLPIIAKGILTVDDSLRALSTGVNAIIVSNHGGREEDSDPATIDVLSNIVQAVSLTSPDTDVYLDGGIRNGWDVYKAIGKGAKMVFIGGPIVWGLAKAGEDGVREVLSILQREFNEAMLLAGASNPSEISADTVELSTSGFSRC